MSAAERKRRQIASERSGRATVQAVDRAIVKVFRSHLRNALTDPATSSATVHEVAQAIIDSFAANERPKAAALLGIRVDAATGSLFTATGDSGS